jgi:YHS domain-containing protein
MLRMISESALIALFVAVSLTTGEATDAVKTATVQESRDAQAKPSKGLKTWLSSYDDAKQAAMEANLPLLLHFEADWCGACRTMDSSVLNKNQVLNLLGTTVMAARIDADRDPSLISRFSIGSLPTDVILGPDGTEIARYVGGTSVSDYTARLSRVSGNKTDGEALASNTSIDDEKFRPCLLERHDGKVVGLGGYSPVAMRRDKQWIKCSDQFVGSWRGVDYFFQSSEERDLFMATPDQFVPRLHGFDPVEIQLARRARPGAIELGAFYKGQLYFFLNKRNRERFQNNPAWYTEQLLLQDVQNVEEYPFLRVMDVN